MADYKQRYLNGFELTKEWYSTREVAELFGVTVSTVHAWIKSGCINGAMMHPRQRRVKQIEDDTGSIATACMT